MKRVISSSGFHLRSNPEVIHYADNLRWLQIGLKAHPEYHLDQDLSFRDLGVSGFTGKHLERWLR